MSCSSNNDNNPVAPLPNPNPQPCTLGTPTISSNSPVTAGNYIQLQTPFVSTMAEYHWTGPNGFVSSEQNPSVVASTASAGMYSLVVNEGSCASPTGSTTIIVTTPTAPCNPTNNTATNSVFPTMTFNSVLHSINQDQYEINANGSNGDLTIVFANANLPTAGVYEVCPNCPTSFMNPNQVCISIVTGGTFSYYYRASAGSVYVSYVGGKISATYCSVAFTGPDGGANFTSSAKVTASN